MSPILKLDQSDENRQLDFELDYQLSLSTEERFRMMFKKSGEIKQMLLDHGHRNPFEVIKRS